MICFLDFFEKKKRFSAFGQVKGDARYGRPRHRPMKVFQVCRVNLATLKVAITPLSPTHMNGPVARWESLTMWCYWVH